MRRADLIVGQQYRLMRSRSDVRVTILGTPPDVEGRGLVRVRHEGGVGRGNVTDQQLRFIEPLTPPARTIESARTGEQFLDQVPGPWPPEPGHRLHWPAVSGELEWVVESADLETGKVELVGEVFGMQQRRTAHLRDVKPLPMRIERQYEIEDDADAAEGGPSSRPHEEPPERDEREALDRTVDRLIFSEACLRQYHHDYARSVPWNRAAGSLDRLLRKNGRLLRKYPREYVRIRTRYFDVRVIKRPTDDQPFFVKRLNPRGPTPKQRTTRGRRRRSKL